MKLRVPFLLVLVLTAAFGGTYATAAEGAREAKAHAERALRQYNLGNFDEAIAEFSKAYDLEPSPVLLYNIAHANDAGGKPDRAIFFYKRYLAESGPDAPNREQAKQHIREIEEKLAKQKDLADKARPVTPPTPSKPPAPDSANSAHSSTPVLAPPPRELPTGGPEFPTPPPSQVEESSPWQRKLAWIAGGGAAVALGTAVAFHVAGSGKFSDFNRSCGLDRRDGRPVPDPQSTKVLTGSQCVDLYNAWTSDRRWAIGGYAAGVALALTSATLFVWGHPTSHASETHAHLECRPGLGTVVCGGSF